MTNSKVLSGILCMSPVTYIIKLEMFRSSCEGIDSDIQKQIDAEAAKRKEILKCILDVILFLAEHYQPFRGSNNKIWNGDNGLFLGTLELLSKHNKVLQMHLRNVK